MHCTACSFGAVRHVAPTNLELILFSEDPLWLFQTARAQECRMLQLSGLIDGKQAYGVAPIGACHYIE